MTCLNLLRKWLFLPLELHRLREDVQRLEVTMAGELAALQAQVAESTAIEQSAITLIQGIKTLLDAAIASGDPAALVKLSADLDASEKALAAAILANTPAAPVP